MDKIADYITSLTITQGRHAGQLLRVPPWEARFVRGVFRLAVWSAALAIAKGNGKTVLLSGVACVGSGTARWVLIGWPGLFL